MKSTTQLGDIAELMTAAELARRGYIVSRPLTNGAPYDLLIDTQDGIRRVQVKKASRSITGAWRLMCSTSKSHRGRSPVSYNGRVDCIIAVDLDEPAYFLIFGNDLQNLSIFIRTDAAKNNQKDGIRLAADYSLDRYFPVLDLSSPGTDADSSASLKFPAQAVRNPVGLQMTVAGLSDFDA